MPSFAPPLGFDNLSRTSSMASISLSPTIGTLKDLIDTSPGPQAKVPLVVEKSSFSIARPVPKAEKSTETVPAAPRTR